MSGGNDASLGDNAGAWQAWPMIEGMVSHPGHGAARDAHAGGLFACREPGGLAGPPAAAGAGS